MNVSCGSGTNLLLHISVVLVKLLEVNPKMVSKELCFLFAMFREPITKQIKKSMALQTGGMW